MIFILTSSWTPYWLKHDFYFLSNCWSHYIILLCTTVQDLTWLWLAKFASEEEKYHMIWNKESEERFCSCTCTKIFLDKVLNFKDFSRPNKEINSTFHYSRTFQRQLLRFWTFSRLYEPCLSPLNSRNVRVKQWERWCPIHQKWQPEEAIFSLSVLWLYK